MLALFPQQLGPENGEDAPSPVAPAFGFRLAGRVVRQQHFPHLTAPRTSVQPKGFGKNLCGANLLSPFASSYRAHGVDPNTARPPPASYRAQAVSQDWLTDGYLTSRIPCPSGGEMNARCFGNLAKSSSGFPR